MNKAFHPPLLFNNSIVEQISNQKHMGKHLHEKLSFRHHLNEKINKTNKGTGTTRKLHNILPRSALLTTYHSFVKSHLEYGDVIYDQPENEMFSREIQRVQPKASLAITGASQEKLYQELVLKSLSSRILLRRMCYFYKIITTQKPLYL